MYTVEKRGKIFLLTLTGNDEHRLSPTLIDSIKAALAEIRTQSTPGSALVTTCHGKFFSNGFDLAWAAQAGSGESSLSRLAHMVECFKPLVADLLSFPMPTIAAVTGHAAAAGFVLALSHDYVLMRSDRGVLYMSELDIGMTLPDYFIALLREKIGKAADRRDVLLAATKLGAEEAVRMGIAHSAHHSGETTLDAAMRLGEKLAGRRWNGEVYSEIRKAMHPEVCRLLGLVARPVVASKL